MPRFCACSRSLLLFTLVLASASYLGAQEVRQGRELAPDGKGGSVSRDAKVGGTANNSNCPNGICYHGGPVMIGVPNIYLIWYGNWNGSGSNTAGSMALVDGFLDNLGGSSYENINTTYSVNGHTISGSLRRAADIKDAYSLGTTLSDAGVQSVVFNAITNGLLPADSNGVYFVLTSSDVNESSGFCTQYCGWHNHGSNGALDIKYAFVGNPDRCPTACEAQTTSPNNDSGADGMINIIAHEQEEAISDPDLNAWFDRRGAENADKCAWTFGTESTASNGSAYNITLANVQYLIQRNWVNASGGFCSMSH